MATMLGFGRPAKTLAQSGDLINFLQDAKPTQPAYLELLPYTAGMLVAYTLLWHAAQDRDDTESV